jgi:hypothetical protein
MEQEIKIEVLIDTLVLEYIMMVDVMVTDIDSIGSQDYGAVDFCDNIGFSS